MKFNSRILVTITCFILFFTFISPINVHASAQSTPTNLIAKGKYVPASVSSTGTTIPAKKGIELRWTAPTLAQKYEIYRSTSSAGPFSLLKTVDAPTVTYFDTSINTGVAYYYKIRAYHTHLLVNKDFSAYTAVVNAIYAPVTRIDTNLSEYRPVLEGLSLNIIYSAISVSPYVPTYSNLKFTSSNSAICSVSSTGVLTGKILGTATITITSIESPTVYKTVKCTPKIGHETTPSKMEAEILRTWGSAYKLRVDGVTPVKIMIIADGRQFGASRDDGRYHAGVDFYVRSGVNTPVYAMTSGYVQNCSFTGYWQGTGHLTVQNDDGTVARYAEILPTDSVCKYDSVTKKYVAVRIQKGALIGKLVQNTLNKGTMLHFVLFKGTRGSNTSRTGPYLYLPYKNYQEYVDLLNPQFLAAKFTIE